MAIRRELALKQQIDQWQTVSAPEVTIAQRSMCPRAVVKGLEVFQNTEEVILIQDDSLVQVLAFERSDDTFGETNLPGRLVCNPDVYNVCGLAVAQVWIG